MTKVTMPDPQLIVDFCENADLHVWEAGNERSSGVVRSANRGEYITTDQAESYANQRVKQALEDAASMADDVFALSVGDSIRALIPATK